MRIVSIAGLLAALVVPSAFGQVKLDETSVKQAVGVYEFLNELCRGGSGDNPKTQQACDNRDNLESIIQRAGWCYGHYDQPSYLKKWERCGAEQGAKASSKPAGVFSSSSPMPKGAFSSATTAQPPKPMINRAKGNCFLLSGILSNVPTMRDNGWPIASAHANVEQAMLRADATPQEKQRWHDTVVSIYSSKVSSAEVEKTIRPSCEKMPGEPG